MNRAILHVDMDAFYASVEQRDDPALRGRPVIVGGHPRRGVVLAASYEVRPFGVRSAMPMARALKLAPKAVIVPPRPTAYAEASERVFSIFERFTPLVEPLSLDEAFLDVTASLGLFGTAAGIARKIREQIQDEVRLPASAGIATAKLVAKIASDFAKPNGQKEVRPEDTLDFLAPLPVGRLWGVGPRAEEGLHALGLRTIGDIAARRPDWLEHRLGDFGRELWRQSRGEDDRAVIPDRAAKSIGSEDTFEEDLEDSELLKPHLHSQALRVGRRLRRAGLQTRVVQLKLKYSDFQLVTRRMTLETPTDDGQALYRAAVELLSRVAPQRAVRLTGISAQELVAEEEQLGLFVEGPTRAARVNAAMDRIAEKFGASAILPADVAASNPHDDEDEARREMGAAAFDNRANKQRKPRS